MSLRCLIFLCYLGVVLITRAKKILNVKDVHSFKKKQNTHKQTNKQKQHLQQYKKMSSASSVVAVDPTPIYTFYPNLIGYFRIALAFLAFAVGYDYPLTFLIAYTLSFVLDAADGWAARKYNQSTMFGAILDMFTDRAATAAVIVVISHVVQAGRLGVFIAATLAFLDVASHFTRMYVMSQLRKASHKDTSSSIFTLLRHYYGNRMVMAAFCIGQELSYILTYAYFFYADEPVIGSLIYVLLVVMVPLCFLKQVVNVQQLVDAMYHLSVLDAEERAAKKQ